MIPLFRSPTGIEEAEAVREVLESYWIGPGPKVAQLETEFAAYLGVEYAVAVNSCSAALHIACELADVRGGEVIVPAITFASTALAPEWAGAAVVFADIEEETLCLDWDSVIARITMDTKAVIPVHLGGRPCIPPDGLTIPVSVIEDCAQACGGKIEGGHKLGTLYEFGCFSFEAKKNMTTADGGMLVCKAENMAKLARQMRWCGISKDTWNRSGAGYSWDYDIACQGFKYNMTDIDAAIGLVQLGKLKRMNMEKRYLCEVYSEQLGDLGWLRLLDNSATAPWLFQVRVTDRPKFMTHLADRGVQSGVHFKPLYLHPHWRGNTHCPTAERVWPELVSLPLYVGMTEDEQAQVIETVRSYEP